MGKCLFMRKGKTHTSPLALPAGFTKLVYIQSSGTQYVDTLFNPTQNTKLVLDMAFWGSAGTNVAGVRNNSRDTTNRFGIISFGSTSKLGAFFRNSSIQAVTLDNNRHLCDLSKDGLVFDGTSYGGANAGSFTCTYSLTLFAWNNGADGVTCNLCKVYSCQIYDNGTIVRNYIPCQTTAGEVGLWDALNKMFYRNAGTGTFTAGPVKVSPLNLPVNIGGTWKNANEVFVNIGGTWKTVESAFVNIGGTWKELG